MENQVNPESLSIIEKAKISESEGQSAFMNPEPKKAKKSPGRPKKEQSEKTEQKTETKKAESKGPMIETKALCYPLVKGVSVMGVSYTNDPRAALTAQEADQMAEAMGLIFDKYLPNVMTDWGAEAAIVMAFGQYGLRLYAIKKLQEETKKQQPQPQRPAEFQQEVKNELVVEPQPMAL